MYIENSDEALNVFMKKSRGVKYTDARTNRRYKLTFQQAVSAALSLL
jgi:hypothetical protein